MKIENSIDQALKDNCFYYGTLLHSTNEGDFYALDRKSVGNNFLTGDMGSGAVTAMCYELKQVLEHTDDDVMLIGGYDLTGRNEGISQIKITDSTGVTINPLDVIFPLDQENVDETIDLLTKIVMAIYSALRRSALHINDDQLTADDENLIKKCVSRVFIPFLQGLREKGFICDFESNPTLEDVYKACTGYMDIYPTETINFAFIMEKYLDTYPWIFSSRTNVPEHGRMGLNICWSNLYVAPFIIYLTFAINRARLNKKTTWIYVSNINYCMNDHRIFSFLNDVIEIGNKNGALFALYLDSFAEIGEYPELKDAFLEKMPFVQIFNSAPLDRVALQNFYKLEGGPIEHLDPPPGNCLNMRRYPGRSPEVIFVRYDTRYGKEA